jgi:uncharacterized membrane protein YphA (DoxX/SURF4 family)
MNKRLIGYWVATVLVALAMLPGGVADALRIPEAVEIITGLGYPSYFLVIIGVWKILGALAILAPKMPLIKEWAYAGIFFDLTGAAASHVAKGDGPDKWAMPIVAIGILFASWWLRPESRKLPGVAARPTAVEARAA